MMPYNAHLSSVLVTGINDIYGNWSLGEGQIIVSGLWFQQTSWGLWKTTANQISISSRPCDFEKEDILNFSYTSVCKTEYTQDKGHTEWD